MGVFTPAEDGSMLQAARLDVVARDEQGETIETLSLLKPRLDSPPEPANTDREDPLQLGRPRIDVRGPARWRWSFTGEDPYVTVDIPLRRRHDADERVAEVIKAQLRELGALPSPARDELPPDWTARLRDVVAQGERLLHGWERWDENTRQGALHELECRIGELG